MVLVRRDFFYGDRLEPRYLRPHGSALGKYSAQIPDHDASYPRRTGVCYRDTSNAEVEYKHNGSRDTWTSLEEKMMKEY